MTKSLGTPEYTVLRQTLITLRHQQGVTQRDLAAALGVPNSWVSSVETGDRRIDLVEVIWISKALGRNPSCEIPAIVRAMLRWSHKTEARRRPHTPIRPRSINTNI